MFYCLKELIACGFLTNVVNDKIEITNFDYEKITDLGSY